MAVPALSIASWNIENLGSYLGAEPKVAKLSEALLALGSPDLLCLQELRVRPNDTPLVAQAESALPGYVFYASLADDKKNAKFRGGRAYGVGTYVKTSLDHAFLPNQSWDREGRLCAVALPDLKLAIINVYAVNGTSRPHWDNASDHPAGDRHGWKVRFQEHVAETARSFQEQGLDLVLIGDWNVSQARIDITPRLRTEEPHANARAHFAETVVNGLDVADVFRARSPDLRAYTWFNKFAKRRLDAARVDFALVQRSRVGLVEEASIDDDPQHRFASDHAPIYLRLGSR